MKNQKFLKTSLISFITLGALTGAFLSAKSYINEIKAEAATDRYANANTSSASALFNSLKTISNQGYHSVGYDGLFDVYKVADVKNGKIVDIYSNTTNYKIGDRCGNYSGEGSCYNREHSTPKSWWGGSISNQGCDAFIVYPSDGFVNGKRSNYPFGETSLANATYKSNNNYCLLGKSTFSGYSGVVFEPADEFKGDLARSAFYAVTKWYNVDFTKSEGRIIYSGTNGINFGLTNYAKSLYLHWNEIDPVDDWERSRNAGVEKVQGNRNPYIDHPEYIDIIWGNSGGGGGSSSSSSSKPSSSQGSTNSSQSKISSSATTNSSTSSEKTSSSSTIETNDFSKIISKSELLTGPDYIYTLGCSDEETILGEFKEGHFKATEGIFDNNGTILKNSFSNGFIFNIYQEDDTYVLKDMSGNLLGAKGTKSLTLGDDEAENNWLISFSDTNVIISSTNPAYGKLGYNSTILTNRFTTYANYSNNILQIQLYRLDVESPGPHVDPTSSSKQSSSSISEFSSESSLESSSNSSNSSQGGTNMGCSSSLMAGSLIVSLAALIGFVFILIRKKKSTK